MVFRPHDSGGASSFPRSAISLRKGFCVATKIRIRVLSILRWRRKVSPLISSVLAPKIAASNSPHFGEAGCLFKVSVPSRPRNDSGSPAHGLAQLRVRPVFAQHQVQPHRQLAGHRHPSTALRAGFSPARDACAPPAGDRSGPARRHSVPPTVRLPPAKNARTDCLAYSCVPVAAVRRWSARW